MSLTEFGLLESHHEPRFESSLCSFCMQSVQDENFQTEALNKELQEYKQALWNAKDENNLLKVKVRRLEESLRRKNKIVDTHYLGPHNKLLFKETIMQMSHKVETLQQENFDLKEEMSDKDFTIQQMRKKLSTYAAYKPKQTTKTKVKRQTTTTVTGSRATTVASTAIDECDQCDTPLLKTDQTDTERSIQQCDTQTSLNYNKLETPHEEIEKLHSGFKDIVDEVNKLKQSMSQFNAEHAKAISEMRMREKGLLEQLYIDKQHKQEELALQSMGTPKISNANKKPLVPTQQPQQPRKAVSAFARVSPKAPTKGKGKKHNNPFAIRTGSRNSLLDESDMKLYIDEIIMDMNRDSFK